LTCMDENDNYSEENFDVVKKIYSPFCFYNCSD
jgi:hypothetical protein